MMGTIVLYFSNKSRRKGMPTPNACVKFNLLFSGKMWVPPSVTAHLHECVCALFKWMCVCFIMLYFQKCVHPVHPNAHEHVCVLGGWVDAVTERMGEYVREVTRLMLPPNSDLVSIAWLGCAGKWEMHAPVAYIPGRSKTTGREYQLQTKGSPLTAPCPNCSLCSGVWNTEGSRGKESGEVGSYIQEKEPLMPKAVDRVRMARSALILYSATLWGGHEHLCCLPLTHLFWTSYLSENLLALDWFDALSPALVVLLSW